MHGIHRSLVVCALALTLAACDRGTDTTAGAPGDVAAPPPSQQAQRDERVGQGAADPTQAAGQKPTTQAPDNTGRNTADREGQTPTPMDQSNDPRDVETTRKIRDAITSQEGLSVNARNVKVITQGGAVVLRGPVNSEEEKQKVESLARSAAGGGQVQSQLEVAPGT